MQDTLDGASGQTAQLPANKYVDPTTGLTKSTFFDTTNKQTLSANVVPFNLSDVSMFVSMRNNSNRSILELANPATGVVDISQIPQMLLQRVDVVTGGASASWGSDAVSGVVNSIVDRKFEGFKMNLNGGISNYADDPKAQIQFAAGTSFLGGRAHIEFSGEFTSEAGINSLQGARKWWQFPQQLQMFSLAQCQPNGCSPI